MSDAPILFADFKPGERLGQVVDRSTEEQVNAWAGLYGYEASSGMLPRAMVTAFMMRAYLSVVSPRPPGNLHIRQRMRIHSGLQPGEIMASAVSCAAKTIKGERRQVELEVVGGTLEGRRIYSGTLTLYWAA